MPSRFKFPRLSSALIQGLAAAALSAVVSGFVPIFGKQAYEAGVTPFTLVMLRTVGAAAALWAAYLIFWRRHMEIYPFGLAACLAAGVVNGLGSLMYYNGLARLNASIGQLLFTLYLIFLTLFSWLDGYRLSRLTLFRLLLALIAVVLLKWSDGGSDDWMAVLMMIGAGAMYALHLSINQRTLYDVPSPTVTLYTLTGMAGTVFIAYLLNGLPPLPGTANAWQPVLLLAAVTITSRLTLFLGVKHLGSMQTVLINLSEALVTILAAISLLGETFTLTQWIGAAVLALSIGLVVREESLGVLPPPKPWMQIITTWLARFSIYLTPPTPPAPQPVPPKPAPSERTE
jgi:drug/metabolite transporter (DMT)-like permease